MALQRSLFTVAIAGLLCAAGASAADSKPPGDKDFIAYDQPLIAFTHATLIDGTGARAVRDQTLVIDHGRIVALGKSQQGEAAARRHGRSMPRARRLLPGFVMVPRAHVLSGRRSADTTR